MISVEDRRHLVMKMLIAMHIHLCISCWWVRHVRPRLDRPAAPSTKDGDPHRLWQHRKVHQQHCRLQPNRLRSICVCCFDWLVAEVQSLVHLSERGKTSTLISSWGQLLWNAIKCIGLLHFARKAATTEVAQWLQFALKGVCISLLHGRNIRAPSQYKDNISRCGDSHVKHKTVARPSYL